VPPSRVAVPADVADDIRAAEAEVERGEAVDLTPEQLKRWAETGEWPESHD
jgi:hypothetical protein